MKNPLSYLLPPPYPFTHSLTNEKARTRERGYAWMIVEISLISLITLTGEAVEACQRIAPCADFFSRLLDAFSLLA